MSLRQTAIQTLTQWSPPDEGHSPGHQKQLRADYLDHLRAHEDAMWKACAQGHLTASALVMDLERSLVLLTLHKKLRKWLQTGGHCEPGDTTLGGAALREATEESGIEGLRPLPGGPVRLDRHLTPCAWHLDVQYAVLAPPGALETISDESLDLRWFRYDEVASVADDSVVRLMEGARALA